jgi:hypothetical protein
MKNWKKRWPGDAQGELSIDKSNIEFLGDLKPSLLGPRFTSYIIRGNIWKYIFIIQKEYHEYFKICLQAGTNFRLEKWDKFLSKTEYQFYDGALIFKIKNSDSTLNGTLLALRGLDLFEFGLKYLL